MYKVLLVDDEPWALRGIRETFKWDEAGFEVIAETTRAAEALEIALQKKPDVVFTDIRMPKISGIELMQRIRENGLATEFIVISGFGEFSYAQQALQQGAFDYCLKPLQLEYADKLLDRLYRHLENKRKSRDTELFEMIMDSGEDAAEKLNILGLPYVFPFYQAVITMRDRDANAEEIDFFHELNSLEIILGKNKKLYLINTDKNLYNLFVNCEVHGMTVGISGLHNLHRDISRLYNEANLALNSSFIYGEGKIFEYREKNIREVNSLVGKITSLVNQDEMDDLKPVIDGIPDYFRSRELFIEDLLYLWNQLTAFLAMNFAAEAECTGFDFMDLEQFVLQFRDISCFSRSIYNEILFLKEKNKATEELAGTSNADFNKLLAYVREHFCEQLFLRDLAKRFYINQNYCCYLFKKYTGNTFSAYLNKLRIERSAEMLKNPEMTIDEIAQGAGYSDYFYFNKVFKKYYGTTPSQYRRKFANRKAGNF